MPFIVNRQTEEIEDSPKQELDGNFIVQRKKYEEGWGEYLKDIGKSSVKGIIEGLGKAGRMIAPLQTFEPEKEIQEKQTQSLDDLIEEKTEPDYLKKSLRRGLGESPSMMAFPGSTLQTLPRSILAGFSGQAAQDLGLPEWAQTAAEITAYLGPDITKKLISSGSNKEIIDAGRKFGLNDNQIAPLLKKDFKEKWLSKLSPKRGRTEKILSETKSKLGDAYDTLKKSPAASGAPLLPEREKLLRRFTGIAEELPSTLKEKVNKDFLDFVKKPPTGENLIRLYKKLSKNFGPKTRELGMFKEPIKEALSEINPELGKEFEQINHLFSRYFKIADKLKPTLASDIVNAAEVLGAMGSFFTGNYSLLGVLAKEKAGRLASRELLLNPHLQQLSEKFLLALNQNAYGLAAKILKKFNKDLKKEEPNIKNIQEYSAKELKELF